MPSRSKAARRAEPEHKHKPKSHSVEKDEKKPIEELEVDSKRLSEIDPSQQKTYSKYCTLMTILAAAVRFCFIWYPSEVVFDEVHFGKFASYYLQRTYFFDLHPPFAKLLIAFVAYLSGYDGKFKFDDIGDSYLTHSVPYIPMRALSAVFGTFTVTLVFNIMKESGYSVLTCIFTSALIALDNAHVGETRLILLDATLIFFVAASIYCYIRFYKQRKQPFSKDWYLWLFLTGLSLSSVISTKYVGVFTYASIGIAVVYDLWQILDVKRGNTLRNFAKHFTARLMLLVVIPFCVYLFWFWVHFTVLSKSGPGDNFMTPEFQETLGDSVLAKEAKDVHYHDVITIKHKDTECLLHSHLYNYPLRYEDGRISSQGQQVTCVNDFNDTNNYWEILPSDMTPQSINKTSPVREGDSFRLRHVKTNGYLLTHDVASPFYPTNEEFTVVPAQMLNQSNNMNDTVFKFDPVDKRPGNVLKSKASFVKIRHVPTVVAMWTHNDKLLPSWGFNQQEVNGNKEIKDSSNIWYVDSIIGLTGARALYLPKQVKKLPFLRKWIELQGEMFKQNNELSSEHPYASEPQDWPMCLSGVSFWTKNDSRQQIFFVGNIPCWWLECVCMSCFLAIVALDLVTRRRGVYMLNERARKRVYMNISFFFAAWACHYFPFFLMGRQRFLHHYLPAHLLAALLSGAIIEFLFTNNRTAEFTGDRKSIGKISVYKYRAVIVALLAVVVWGFVFFAPITYGNVSLSVEEVKKRQWMNMKLHFTK